MLRKRGIDNVRPLAGGLDGWRERGFPITSAEEVDQDAVKAAPSR
jgi:rhodanese-related sulfurtransferase